MAKRGKAAKKHRFLFTFILILVVVIIIAAVFLYIFRPDIYHKYMIDIRAENIEENRRYDNDDDQY